MVFKLKQVFEIVGEVLPFDLQIDLSDYDLFGRKPFQLPVHVKGKIENKANVVLLEFDTNFQLDLLCDRCLKPFSQPFSYSFDHVLVREVQQETDEYLVVEQDQLDLDDLVLADILLYLPSKFLCQEDCKGLCSQCGQDLNEKNCGCSRESEKSVDPRLAALGELLK